MNVVVPFSQSLTLSAANPRTPPTTVIHEEEFEISPINEQGNETSRENSYSQTLTLNPERQRTNTDIVFQQQRTRTGSNPFPAAFPSAFPKPPGSPNVRVGKRQTVDGMQHGSFRDVDRHLRIIRVSYFNELDSDYLSHLSEYNNEHLETMRAGNRQATVDNFILMDPDDDDVDQFDADAEPAKAKPKKKEPDALAWIGIAIVYFLFQMGCMYMWLIPGRVYGIVLIGIMHAAIFGFISYGLWRNWERKFYVTSSNQGHLGLGLFFSMGLLFLIVPVWVFLISETAQTATFLWISLIAILLTDFIFLTVVVGLWLSLQGPIHIAGLTAALFYLYLLMNVLGMTSGGYINGIMKTAPSRKLDWLTFWAKGSAQVIYVNFFLQATCIFRSFVDPLFASSWWLGISRNRTSTYVPVSSIKLHMMFNIVSLMAWVSHTSFHIFRFRNYGFWTWISGGCVGGQPPLASGLYSYSTYFCPDLYYYLVTGVVLCGLFTMQSVFSASRHQIACMYYLRVWHRPVSFLIYIVFTVHSRSCFVLVFVLFQLMDEMINGWKLLEVRSITLYTHNVKKNSAHIQVATVMNVVLNYRSSCTPGNYAFIRLKYNNSPPENIPFTIVGGPNNDYISFNIEINLGKSRVATTWFSDIFGIGAKKLDIELKDVRVHMFGPFASTPKPMTAYENVIVLAQGIGITPGAALLKTVIRNAVKSGVRTFQTVTVYWSNSRDKREYEDEMILFNEDNVIESMFEEDCEGIVSHSRREKNVRPEFKDGSDDEVRTPRRKRKAVSYFFPKRKGPLVDCRSPVWINLVISGGGRGRFSAGFFYKEFSHLKSVNSGNFGVFCCGKAMWRQMCEIKPIFENLGSFDFHNETF